MAAARNIPMPETATWTIAIDDTFTPTPQGIIVRQGDTVNFQNNSGADITIEFAANPPGPAVSSNLSVNDGATVGFTAPSANAAANYGIYQGTTQESGPWVIQVGTGPMYVHITQTAGVVSYTPQTVAVPLGNTASGMGKLAICSDLPSTSFNIAWGTGGDPFHPALGSTDCTPHPVGAGVGSGEYGYTAAPSVTGTGGGGKVIIQN